MTWTDKGGRRRTRTIRRDTTRHGTTRNSENQDAQNAEGRRRGQERTREERPERAALEARRASLILSHGAKVLLTTSYVVGYLVVAFAISAGHYQQFVNRYCTPHTTCQEMPPTSPAFLTPAVHNAQTKHNTTVNNTKGERGTPLCTIANPPKNNDSLSSRQAEEQTVPHKVKSTKSKRDRYTCIRTTQTKQIKPIHFNAALTTVLG